MFSFDLENVLIRANRQIFHGEIPNHGISVTVAYGFQEFGNLPGVALDLWLDAAIVQILDEAGQVMVTRGS